MRSLALTIVVAGLLPCVAGSAAAEGVFTDHQAGKSWYYDRDGKKVGEVVCGPDGMWRLVSNQRAVYPCRLISAEGTAEGGTITAGREVPWKK